MSRAPLRATTRLSLCGPLCRARGRGGGIGGARARMAWESQDKATSFILKGEGRGAGEILKREAGGLGGQICAAGLSPPGALASSAGRVHSPRTFFQGLKPAAGASRRLWSKVATGRWE